MSTLDVFIAHSGLKLVADTSRFVSIDDFKSWVSHATSIPTSNLVALTRTGRSAKTQSLHLETEFFIYDTRVSSSKTPNISPLISQAPQPDAFEVFEPPNSIHDIKSIASWKELYRKRQEWGLKITADCERLDSLAFDRFREIDVTVQCIDVALMNLDISIKPLQSRYEELKKWSPGALKENEMLATEREKHLKIARSVPTLPEMVSFMTGKQIQQNAKTTLEDLLEPEISRRVGRSAMKALERLKSYIEAVDNDALNMIDRFRELSGSFESLLSRSILTRSDESRGILEAVQSISKKIDTDYQTILPLSGSPKDLAQISRTALTHTDKLLPTLAKRATELSDLLLYVTENRNAIAIECGVFMRTITEVVSLLQRLKNSMARLGETEDDMATFDYLRLIHQLPYMYSSFIAEAVRRREWKEKITTDSANLANTMAMFQDEETKRRRKWAKMVGSTYRVDKVDSPAMGMEVNLQGGQENWPELTKRDLEAFITVFGDNGGDLAILEDIQKLLGDLNAPTRQQVKRIKAFKNGSLHETSMGFSGLLIRGDEDLIRSLQDDKVRLESKAMTAESRIKRLEDLLHRQNQARSQPFSSLDLYNKGSPRLESRRLSTTEHADSALVAQLEQLKEELASEREKTELQQKTIAALNNETEVLRKQSEDSNSTKKDLFDNLEALKREFNEERRSLLSEANMLREKLEETEDYMENFGMSRENEKATYDERVHSLSDDLEKERKGRHDEKLKYDGQIEYLRTETRLQRETMDTMQKQIQTLQEENKGFAKKLSAETSTTELQNRVLDDLYRELLPGAELPTDRCDLTDNLLSKASEIIGRVKTIENDISVLQSELDQTQSTNKQLRASVAESSKKLVDMEAASDQLRESLAEEKAKSEATEAELEQGRKEIRELRVRISDGETGSESLQRKLEEDEKKSRLLKEELARRQSQVGRLEEELRCLREKFSVSQAKYDSLDSLFQIRTEKAKDLTKRIYTQNDRLVRLLERLGFVVTREGATMSVQRIPRSERSTAQLVNPNESLATPSLVRQASAMTTRSGLEGEDLDQIYWMNNSDANVESEKYSAFINSLGGFDMETFTETVYRRLKDMEHLARKFQRDARAYRDKAHVMQKEAHEKIAFKNFKEGDLALFLPTRNQTSGAWAAFNVGFPHYFLREQDSHRLRTREWIVARITRVQERVVDLSRSLQNANGDADSVTTNEENDNPFQLSDGLHWYLIDAHEDKPGAPSTPGLGKSTVAGSKVSAVADLHIHTTKSSKDKRRSINNGIEGVSKTLSRNLESRRSSNSSRKAFPLIGSGSGSAGGGTSLLKGSALASETNSIKDVTSPGVMSPRVLSPVVATASTSGAIATATNNDEAGSSGMAGAARRSENTALGSSPSALVDGAAASSRRGHRGVRDVIDSLMGP
ncbi:Autophagy-related protein 11 [Ceratocystis lukuohia]|uniref:Autophagy-related protein 11 n=1 Tax=Ceratocystis lukuohia TaxID=2019550 RepID=A0ABR4MES2_9PEZI